MSNPEQEPSAEYPPLNPFRLEFNTGEEMTCHRGNTTAFIHSEQPEVDHLFIRIFDEDGEVIKGHYVFREQIGQFDEIVLRMDASNWQVIESDVPEEGDLEAYQEFLAIKNKNIELSKQKEFDLTPRQNNLANFVAYLLLHERLRPNDFYGSGDLYI